jgi:hypothetical protein
MKCMLSMVAPIGLKSLKVHLVGAVIGAIGCGLAGAGCGTVVLPVVGTVTVGAVCAVGGFIGGASLFTVQ